MPPTPSFDDTRGTEVHLAFTRGVLRFFNLANLIE